MARITAVKVWGFRSHVSSLFPLAADGLTVITGKNDAGKSAFIQAIKWLAFGEPSGEEFLFTIRNEETQEVIEQAEEAGIEVTLDNGVTITKTRKKGKTMYKLSTITDPFEKAEVPLEVIQELGLSKLAFGDFETEPNFAYQLAGPWILSEPASTGAKVLGKLAGTEVVDLAIRAVAKDTYQARQERLQAEKEAGQRSLELLEYQDLEAFKEQLDACDILLQDLEQRLKRRDNLQIYLADYVKVTTSLETLVKQLDKLTVIPDIEKDLQDAEKAQQRYDKLLDLYSQYGKATAIVDKLTETLAAYQGLELVSGFLNVAERANQRYVTLFNLYALYQKNIYGVNAAQETLKKIKDLDVATSYIQAAEMSLEKLLRLKQISTKHKEAIDEVNRYQAAIDSTTGLEEAFRLITDAEEKQRRIASLNDLLIRYNVKAQMATQAKSRQQEVNQQFELAKQELNEAWASAGGICPLCGQPVQESSCQ